MKKITVTPISQRKPDTTKASPEDIAAEREYEKEHDQLDVEEEVWRDTHDPETGEEIGVEPDDGKIPTGEIENEQE